jgi:hypothetical protein
MPWSAVVSGSNVSGRFGTFERPGRTETPSLREYQMLDSLAVTNNHGPQRHAQDAELLKESGVHKLVVVDRDGNCLAFVLAWDGFDYDAETDTYVCVADRDGREIMTVYTEGEIKSAPGAGMYVVTAPDGSAEGRRRPR